MKYIFAYDGGGTKTRINVIDLTGQIHFDLVSSGSNITSSGDIEFKRVIKGLFEAGKEALKISNDSIAFIFLGLSGADLDEDFQRLEMACNSIFEDLPYKIVNDAWIILRSGLKKPYGACCISGTGTNACAMNQKGDKAILRALSYMTGTFGGGLDIARDALHYAFRSEEKTFNKTLLEIEIPKLLGVKDLKDMIPLLYPKRLIDKKTFGDITGVVEMCALNNDQVSLMILENNARHIALQTVGVIKQVGMENESVPVVVGGRVFQIKSKIYLDTFRAVLEKEVPLFKLVIPKFSPVVGAYLFALDELGYQQTKAIESQLMKSGGRL